MMRTPALAAAFSVAVCGFAAVGLAAMPTSLPASTSPQFCAAVQQAISSTSRTGENTVFKDMPSYRHSKPLVQPHSIFQVVTYSGQQPVVVSCKMKTAAHLRDAYGPDAAGEQFFCPDIARVLQRQAVAELTAEGKGDAAARVAAFVVDQTEPVIAGKDYLADFRAIYRGDDGAIHINAAGLYQDYDAWYTMFLPEIVQGQTYCHLATVESLKAVATGEMEPGATYTTADDAPTQPK